IRQQRFHHETPEPLPGLLLLELGNDQRERLARRGGAESPCLRLLLLLAAIVLRVLRRWALGDLECPPGGLEHLRRIVQRDEFVCMPPAIPRNGQRRHVLAEELPPSPLL